MLSKLLLWVRRNTRKTVALALIPGLAVLAVDANIAHFFGGRGSEDALLLQLQRAPVLYGAAGALVLLLIAFTPKTAFLWGLRILGGLGVAVGVTGTVLHLSAASKLLEGDWSWANLQGTLPDAPPVFAPLAFAGVGALLFVLASRRLLVRAKLGQPPVRVAGAEVVPLDPNRKQTG